MTLYKYLIPNLKIILDTQEIRFSQPEVFNDPFESFPFIQQLITEAKFDELLISTFPEYITDKFIKENITTTLKEELPLLTSEEKARVENSTELVNNLKLKISDFVSMAKISLTELSSSEWLKLSKNIKEKINKTLGILCLSETNDDLIMWAHYANSHRGFLIGFDSSNTFFNQTISDTDTIRFIKPVTYTNRRLPLTLLKENGSDEAAIEELISQFFFIKSTHWEAEKEWRMILPLRDANRVDKEMYLFKVPPNAITEVIFGCNMQQIEKEEILGIINKDKTLSHVKIKEATLSYNEYSLSINDL